MSQAHLYLSNTPSPSLVNPNFPKLTYNPLMMPTFATKESENQWFTLCKSIEWVKPMVCCLAPHKGTMNALEIRDRVYAWFNKASLKIDIVMAQPAYKTLVYEFLASFSLIHGEKKYDENSAWEFRIQNRDFRWSRSEVNRFLGFPEVGIPASTTAELRFGFWRRLSGLNHYGNYASPYSIKNEAWQYVHRLVATNINGQPETVDCVSEEDLDVMWALEQEEPVDWFSVFSKRFSYMQEQYSVQKFVGCTSLITLIAKVCGFQIYCKDDGYYELDYALLKRLRLLARPVIVDPPSDTESDPEEPVSHEEPNKDEPEGSNRDGKKRKIEIAQGKNMNDKVEWDKVRRVVIYEF